MTKSAPEYVRCTDLSGEKWTVPAGSVFWQQLYEDVVLTGLQPHVPIEHLRAQQPLGSADLVLGTELVKLLIETGQEKLDIYIAGQWLRLLQRTAKRKRLYATTI